MRLVHCREVGTRVKVHKLTAEYLPHNKGRMLTYDMAYFTPLPKGKVGKPTVMRQVWVEGDGGKTETQTTHSQMGMSVKSILEPPLSKEWVNKGSVNKTRYRGVTYMRSLTDTFVEVAQQSSPDKPAAPDAKMPVLKLGAKAGDSWEWKGKSTKHTFTLEGFEDFKGKPCAVIKETIRKDVNDLETTEIVHKYALDIGEIERSEVIRTSPKEAREVSEWRIVDVEEPQK
jgi:hypothetical protein